MTKIENFIEIEAKPEEVFNILKDFEEKPKWDKFTKNCRIISSKKEGTGTRIRYTSSGFKKYTTDEIITEYEENKKIGTKVLEGKWPSEELIQLEKTPRGTKLTCNVNLEIPSYDPKKNKLVDSNKMNQNMMESLEKLKEYIEKK